MAAGKASADAKEFELVATHDDANFGIRATPFLDYAFKTTEFRIKVTINPDGTWTYEEDTFCRLKERQNSFITRIAIL